MCIKVYNMLKKKTNLHHIVFYIFFKQQIKLGRVMNAIKLKRRRDAT
jgi:hypothetical protein